MGPDNIKISLSESSRAPEVSQVRIDGVVDTLTASELEQVFDSLLRRSRYNILVDLAGVDYISSAGWGIFISHIRDIRDNNGDVILANMVAEVQEIFELLEFDKVLETCSSVEEGIRKFPNTNTPPDKKKSETTRVEVVEPVVSEKSTDAVTESLDPDLLGQEFDLELFALRMLKNDPFVTISEIRREFAHRLQGCQTSWWSVFSILRRNRLLRRRSRFRYAWGRA